MSPFDAVAGVVHAPAGPPTGAVMLTHGAGGSRDAPLLIALCEAWAARGWLAVRYDLPFRRRRPTGPPSHSEDTDTAGIAEAVVLAHRVTGGPVIAGGHSYGGRMTSLAAARHLPGMEHAVALTLSSYPLHPPGRPERLRTAHLPNIDTPTVVVQGSSDPFGGADEVRAALTLVTAPTVLVAIPGARHDLRSRTHDVAALTVTAALGLLG